MRRTLGASLAVILASTLGACADESSETWPVPAAGTLEFEGMLWAKGDTIGDLSGPLFEVDPAPGYFVAAGGGVYYGARNGGLYYATAEGVTAVPRTAVPSTLRASPDRRWLAFIDEAPHPDEAVVIDTRSGTEVLRTAENMETGTGPDDLYPEGQHPQIELVTDEVVWIRTDDGYLRFEPETGDLADGPFDFEG